MERMWSSGLGRWKYGLAIGAAVYQMCELKFRRRKNKIWQLKHLVLILRRIYNI
jgi:hypothetical protein